MSYSTACLCAFLFYFVMNDYQCMKLIPERVEIVYYNKLYFEENLIFNVRRSNRRGDYCCNLVFTSKVPLGNNVTIDIFFYEYLHNEFRRSFPEVHYKLCDLIKNDRYMGKSIRMAGFKTCPIPPGKYGLYNVSFNDKIPSVWPFEKGMAEIIAKNIEGVLLGEGKIVLTFKQDLRKL